MDNLTLMNQDPVQQEMHQPAPVQQIFDKTQFFQRSAMPTDEQLSQFQDTYTANVTAFRDEYAFRHRYMHPTMEDLEAERQPLVRTAPVRQEQQQQQQPPDDEKAEKKRQKQAAKRLKKGRKLTPHATTHTVTMIEEKEKLDKQRNALQGMYHNAEAAFVNYNANQSEEETQQRRRVYRALSNMMPETQTDKKGVETPESRQQKATYLSRCIDSQPDMIKNCILKLNTYEINPSMYTAEYVGEHFAEAEKEIRYLEGLSELFREGTREYEQLSPLQQKRATLLRRGYVMARAAYETAVGQHGLDAVTLRPRQDAVESAEYARTQNELTGFKDIRNREMDDYIKVQAEQALHNKIESLQEDYRTVRQDQADIAAHSFIQSERLNNPFQFETLAEATSLIESHPEKYAQHKEMIDKMLVEVRNIQENQALLNQRFVACSTLAYDEESVPDKEIRKALEREGVALEKKMDFFRGNCNSTISCMKYLLKGSELTEYEENFMLSYYGFTCPEMTQRVAREKEASELYARTINAKKQQWKEMLAGEDISAWELEQLSKDSRAFMLMHTDDSEQAQQHNKDILKVKRNLLYAQLSETQIDEICRELIAKDLQENQELNEEQLQAMKNAFKQAKDKVEPETSEILKREYRTFMDKVKAFDADKLFTIEDKELVNMQSVLQEIGLENQHFGDLAKYKNPATGISIKDEVISDKAYQLILSSKINAIMMANDKAHAFSMIRSYANGTLTIDALSGGERDKLSLQGDEADQEKLVAYARETYARRAFSMQTVDQNLGVARDSFLHREDVQNHIIHTKRAYNNEDPHPPADKQDYMNRLAAAKQKWEEAKEKGEPVGVELYNKLLVGNEEEQNLAEMIQVYEALTIDHYWMAGSSEEVMNEALFRAESSYNMVFNMKEIADMPAEEFETMCKNLAAGYYLPSMEEIEQMEDVSLKSILTTEVEKAREKNLEGVLTIKNAAMKHYNMLEEKYGLEQCTVEWYAEHMEEFLQEFNVVQTISKIIRYTPGALDETNEQDLRLKHQMLFYETYANTHTGNIFAYTVSEEGTYTNKVWRGDFAASIGKIRDSYNYLRKTPMHK